MACTLDLEGRRGQSSTADIGVWPEVRSTSV